MRVENMELTKNYIIGLSYPSSPDCFVCPIDAVIKMQSSYRHTTILTVTTQRGVRIATYLRTYQVLSNRSITHRLLCKDEFRSKMSFGEIFDPTAG